MVTIGDDTLPGTITTLESARSAGVNVGAPGTPVIIGQAYLDDGTASANTAKEITRPKAAADLFGSAEKSQLTAQLQDALIEGAYPVYGIAPPETDVSGEDLSVESGQTFTLGETPIVEVADDISFTINSTSKDAVIYTQGDPANGSPGTDEVLVNPQTGECHADEAVGNSGDEVDYTYVDYTNTFDEITQAKTSNDDFLRDVVDFVAVVDEADSVTSDLDTKVSNMESNGYLAIGVTGAGDGYIDDAGTSGTDETDSYTNSYDSSRLQLINPSRDDEGNSIIGAYIGERSQVGIDSTPIFNRISSKSALQTNLDTDQQKNLVNERVIPIKEQSGGAKIIEDLTTVEDSNTDEASWDQGISRLVTDFVAETIDAEAEPYIGQFNNENVLNSFAGAVKQELDALLGSRSIEAYSIVVSEVDSETASIDVGINTADPLRNIEITVSAGAVDNGVRVEA